MPTVLIIGGHGQLAQQITKKLTASKEPAYTVHSLIRNADQIADIKKLGALPVVQDIETATVPELTTTLNSISPHVVVWAAGAGYKAPPERIDAVDHLGAVKVMDALAASSSSTDNNKKKRLVSISALDVRDRENKPVPEWYNDDDKQRSEMIWKAIGLFLGAKFKADRELRVGNDKRGLEYTMVRPGGLSNEAGVGLVEAGKVHLGQMVRREDVASVVVACIENPDTIGLAFDVVGGQDSAVDAVKKVGDGRIDTFEGYY